MPVQISYEDENITINDSEEFYVALDITPPSVDGIFLSQIGNNITDIIRTDAQFLKILGKVLGLKGQSKRQYMECFGKKTRHVVTRGETINKALALLANESDQKYFLDSLGRDHLKKCISSIEDFAGCLEWLYGNADRYLMELTGWDFITGFIKTGRDMGIVLRYLEKDEERALLEEMGWDRVIDIIKNPEDLYYVLTGLRENNEKSLIEKIPDEKVRDILENKSNLDYVCKYYLKEESSKLLRGKYGH